MQNILVVSTISIFLLGCGAEIAYKRGATAQDLQNGKAACQQATSEGALNKCLADNGWAIHKLDGTSFSDDELFATASSTADNRMTAVKKEANETMKTTESLESEATPEVKTSKKPNTIKPTLKQTDTSPSSKTTSAKAQPSIFDTYVIKSWWKMGGNLTLLERNMSECNVQLGDAHLPNKKTFTFTRGFAICMRQKGWRGLIEK